MEQNDRARSRRSEDVTHDRRRALGAPVTRDDRVQDGRPDAERGGDSRDAAGVAAVRRSDEARCPARSSRDLTVRAP